MTTWFDKHRLGVAAYLEEKNQACIPDESWWILSISVHEIAAISCKFLQGHGTLLCTQHQTLKGLIREITSKVGIVGSLTDTQRGAIDETTHELSDSSNYSMVIAAMSVFMRDLDLLVKDHIFTLDCGNRYALLQLSASVILRLVDGICVFVAEQTEDN